MKTKNIFSKTVGLMVLLLIFSPTLSFAKGVPRVLSDLKASVLNVTEVKPQTVLIKSEQEIDKEKKDESKKQQEEVISCNFDMPENPIYDARFITIRKKGVVAKGELFETIVYVKNIGNTPWFSATSGCPYLITNLGTEKEKDRKSSLFTNDLFWDSGWLDENRIKMETKRVDPEGLAVFKFWSRAPKSDVYLREFFAPVVEGITWLDSGAFHTDLVVGDAKLDPDKKDLLQYIEYSGDLQKLNIEGEKSINVSISKQKMQLKIGDLIIREFPVSTGTYKTPTPLGTTKISHKQEVRVASSWPKYIMPKWMTFKAGGYGIHALPSLANDNGVYWREALDHIGTRRSHGCIRLLPADAEFTYGFAEVGTTVNVVS